MTRSRGSEVSLALLSLTCASLICSISLSDLPWITLVLFYPNVVRILWCPSLSKLCTSNLPSRSDLQWKTRVKFCNMEGDGGVLYPRRRLNTLEEKYFQQRISIECSKSVFKNCMCSFVFAKMYKTHEESDKCNQPFKFCRRSAEVSYLLCSAAGATL